MKCSSYTKRGKLHVSIRSLHFCFWAPVFLYQQITLELYYKCIFSVLTWNIMSPDPVSNRRIGFKVIVRQINWYKKLSIEQNVEIFIIIFRLGQLSGKKDETEQITELAFRNLPRQTSHISFKLFIKKKLVLIYKSI